MSSIKEIPRRNPPGKFIRNSTESGYLRQKVFPQ